MYKETKLEELALKKLEQRRYELQLSPQDPLPKKVFIEALSGGGILYQYGVRYRRAKNDTETYGAKLDEFISLVADLGNFGIFPTAEERRKILHPPFESFGSVASTNLVRVDFVNRQRIDRQPIHSEISASVSAIPA